MFSAGVVGAMAQPGPRMNPPPGLQTSISSWQAASTSPADPSASTSVSTLPSRHVRPVPRPSGGRRRSCGQSRAPELRFAMKSSVISPVSPQMCRCKMMPCSLSSVTMRLS